MNVVISQPRAPRDWDQNRTWQDRFRAALLAWYSKHARSLPWRKTRNPYHIWIAEILLQQTRVQTALEYYRRFVTRFPDLASLARADLAEVLKVWQGLGYYQRARWLHRTAQILVHDNDGRVPGRYEDLQRLPGFGPYTARAVASIAFGQRVGVVDGNVRRVLARLFAEPRPSAHRLQARVDLLVDPVRPGDFNQALMELGARVCLPHRPQCPLCPLIGFCHGIRTGHPERFPVPRRKSTVPKVAYWVGILTRGNQILMGRQRNNLLHGLWMLPMWPQSAWRHPAELVKNAGVPGLHLQRVFPSLRHTFSHRTWVLSAFHLTWPPSVAAPGNQFPWPEDLEEPTWYAWDQLENVPVPAAHRKLLIRWHPPIAQPSRPPDRPE